MLGQECDIDFLRVFGIVCLPEMRLGLGCLREFKAICIGTFIYPTILQECNEKLGMEGVFVRKEDAERGHKQLVYD